jgi:antitoxin (DNA-binding transcriptional repressor) of toxin-antitoxin stability system
VATSAENAVAAPKREIGIRELKDNLSAALARVRRGETITVTDRKHAIARIVPAGNGERDVGVVIETLVKSGRLSWGGGKPSGVKNAGRVRGRTVAEAVVEDRR